MSDPAFDRYREAIRRGHLAASRGDHGGALAAFDDATALAPDRPMPHVGRGVALHRAGRDSEALEAFDRAIQLAPLDEAALRGRGTVLVALGRHREAAASLTGLAESLEADDRLDEALELSREALALASTPARFRMVARLSASLRRRASGDGVAGGGDDALAESEIATAETVAPRETAAAAMAGGDAAFDAGRLDEARDRYLAAARLHREERHLLAALDACFVGLSIAPADPDLHLVLVEIYSERGWTSLAIDKLLLLGRLLELHGDAAARERLCELVGREFPAEARLAGVCPPGG